MKSSLVLNEADRLRLQTLLEHGLPPPFPDPDQSRVFERMLAAAAPECPAGGRHAGFGDLVTLVSPQDADDVFQLRIVMPREADVDADRISVLAPVSTAVLGRGLGAEVAWETPAGTRTMRVAAIEKAVAVPSGGVN